MNVVGFDPAITVDAAWRLPSQVKRAESVEDVLRMADFVTLHVPLVDATRNLINAQRIGVMRPGAVLLNFAREGVVDNAAVIEALDANKLHAYICDFPANALKGSRQSGGAAASGRLHRGGRGELRGDGGRPARRLSGKRQHPQFGQLPQRQHGARIRITASAIANANVPNMVGQISSVLAAAGLNIHNMVNKSKGDMAYTLVDVDSAVTDCRDAATRRHRRRARRALPACGLIDDGRRARTGALRARIDGIDDAILQLVSERAGIAQQVGRAKQGEKIYRPEREAQIVRRLRETNPGRCRATPSSG